MHIEDKYIISINYRLFLYGDNHMTARMLFNICLSRLVCKHLECKKQVPSSRALARNWAWDRRV